MAFYIWSFTFCLIIAAFIKWLIQRIKIITKLPPGPWGLPLVGYLPWIKTAAYECFMDIGKRYGGLFCLNLGNETIVILNDWKAVKATLIDQQNIFSGRKYFHINKAFMQNKNVVASDGKPWKNQRKLTIQCLKNIGLLKKSMESRIVHLAQEVTEKISQYNNKDAPMMSMFFSSILQTHWKLISETPIDVSKLDQYETSVKELFKRFRLDSPLLVFEWLRFIPPNGFGYKELMKANDVIIKTLKKTINSHLSNWKDGDANDFIDYYIAEIKRQEVPEEPFTVDNLLGSLWDMFVAGIDTTSTTLQWAFLFLAFEQDAQRKVQQELDKVVGRFRMPSLGDFTQLPYTEALIMEVHRKASIVPLSVPHRTIEDAKVLGYVIPKGTTCLQNIYAIHHDPTLWDEPDVFKPERFLDQNNKVIWPPYFMPFSVGTLYFK
ncbi:Cytochrome P450 2 sub R member 1 [Chamberlinius hualienensis]